MEIGYHLNANYSIVETVVEGPANPPTEAPAGHSLDTGQWVWLPVPDMVGTWNFIVREYQRYVLFMQQYLESL